MGFRWCWRLDVLLGFVLSGVNMGVKEGISKLKGTNIDKRSPGESEGIRRGEEAMKVGGKG